VLKAIRRDKGFSIWQYPWNMDDKNANGAAGPARFPVFIALRRSRRLAGLLCVMHGAAAGVVFGVLPWPLALRFALLAALAVSLWRALRAPGVASLRLYADGGLDCVFIDGAVRPARPRPDTAVFFWLVVLRLEIEDEKRVLSLPLLPDSMRREQFRLLRLWLRWSAASAEKA
jgi:hypothetical protein